MADAIESLFRDSLTLRLVSARNAPLVLGFLQGAFKESNRQTVEEEDLELLLEKYLQQNGAGEDPEAGEETPDNRARLYLNLWCRDTHGYLRKVFSPEGGCYVYQLTRHSEKVLQWLRELRTGERVGHVTTESRFARIFNEFKTLYEQTRDDPHARETALLAKRDAIDAEIAQIRATGKAVTLSPEQVKDRLIDLEEMIEAFLADFRAIEDHFKEQAAQIQEIHLKRGRSKGDIVMFALDAGETLRNSEQGKSYYGFREIIRSLESREALDAWIADAAKLAREAGADAQAYETLMERLNTRMSIVQESYFRIAAQLRRVVEESAAQDTIRLLDSIGAVKTAMLARRDTPPEGDFIEIDEGVSWSNLMEVSFHEKSEEVVFARMAGKPEENEADVADAVRRIGRPLDIERFRRTVARHLAGCDQIALPTLLETEPLRDGAVDLVAYLTVAADDPRHMIDDAREEEIDLNRPRHPRGATMNRIIFQKQ
jgi:hypothetical protein